MTDDELLARIDKARPLEFLSRMVRIKSYSQTEGERACATFMMEQMRGLGLDSELSAVGKAAASTPWAPARHGRRRQPAVQRPRRHKLRDRGLDRRSLGREGG